MLQPFPGNGAENLMPRFIVGKEFNKNSYVASIVLNQQWILKSNFNMVVTKFNPNKVK